MSLELELYVTAKYLTFNSYFHPEACGAVGHKGHTPLMIFEIVCFCPDQKKLIIRYSAPLFCVMPQGYIFLRVGGRNSTPDEKILDTPLFFVQ